jgi:integration host factor subunit beta
LDRALIESARFDHPKTLRVWRVVGERVEMTKSELIEAVAERTKITKSRAELVVNCVFDAMTAALERGEGIEIRGYGSFTVRSYKPYDGRNPRTGNQVSVPSKRLPFFKVGKELKTLVNEGGGTGAIKTNGANHTSADADDDDDDLEDTELADAKGA